MSLNKKENGCFICKRKPTERHHIFHGLKRKLAEEDDLTVYLCIAHHRGTYGVHGKWGAVLDKGLKALAEKEYLKNHTLAEWMKRYKKNYL